LPLSRRSRVRFAGDPRLVRRETAIVVPSLMLCLTMSGCFGGGKAASQPADEHEPQQSVAVVRCADTVLNSEFPVPGLRLVLGVASVSPAYVKQVVATNQPPWTHWRKAPLFIRDGSPPIVVSVAKGWRNRVGITWGDSPIVSVLRIRSCPPLVGGASGWTGGFYLRPRAACVPLIFRVGSRTTTVYFGLGRRCDNAK
jgi:hypothetical protein